MKRHLSRRSTYLSLRQSMQVLYVLQLHQDYEASTVHVSSVSEFLLTQPVLSFALLDAGRRRLVKAQEYDAEHAWSCTTGHSAVWCAVLCLGWLGSRVVSVLDSGAVGSGFKSQSRRCRVTVLGKLFTPIVPLFTTQQNWYQPY